MEGRYERISLDFGEERRGLEREGEERRDERIIRET